MLRIKLDFRREGSSIEATNVQLVLVVESDPVGAEEPFQGKAFGHLTFSAPQAEVY